MVRPLYFTGTRLMSAFDQEYMDELLERSQSAISLLEDRPEGGAYLPLTSVGNDGADAGELRLWRAETGPVERMTYVRLLGGPVTTHLFFLNGRADQLMPHFHAQIISFPNEKCVFNTDLIGRLDPVNNPEHYQRVFHPLDKVYREATGNHQYTCASAPGNPALSVYLSPWGIGSGFADVAEFQQIRPALLKYLEHYLSLAGESGWEPTPDTDVVSRDFRHQELLLSDELDPRAWQGVYRIVGIESGHAIKKILASGRLD